MTTTTTAPTIRDRREAPGVTRLQLAIRSAVSVTWLAALEAGYRPRYRSVALRQIKMVLDKLEADEQPASLILLDFIGHENARILTYFSYASGDGERIGTTSEHWPTS